MSLDHLFGCESAGVHRCVQALLPAGLETFCEECRMAQGLAAGEGHSPTRGFEERAIALDLGHQIGDGPGLADEFAGLARAGLGAGAASLAAAVVPVRPSRRPFTVRLRARLDAGAAGGALGRRDGDLGSAVQTLGVVAPIAAQGATLDEDRRADPWTIVDGTALDVEDRHPGRGGINGWSVISGASLSCIESISGSPLFLV